MVHIVVGPVVTAARFVVGAVTVVVAAVVIVVAAVVVGQMWLSLG